MGKVIAVVAFLGGLGAYVTPEFITAAIGLTNTCLILYHTRHTRRSIEPKVDSIKDTADLAKRKLDERTDMPPNEADDWDGQERRHG